MALKITCPHCRNRHRLQEPYPLPGTEVHCGECGRVLSITYPSGMIKRLERRGIAFEGRKAPTAPQPSTPMAKPAGTRRVPQPPPKTLDAAFHTHDQISPDEATTRIPRPSANLPGTEPAADPPTEEPPTEHPEQTTPNPPPEAPQPTPSADGTQGSTASKSTISGFVGVILTVGTGGLYWYFKRSRQRRGLIGTCLRTLIMGAILAGGVGTASLASLFWYYSQDLPTVESLGSYRPPTVTVVYDAKGQLLGEIYEKRRYVVPLADIPDHVKNAFIASEDAKFEQHGGIDYEGILRAIARNLSKGKKAQGASTITMQVARNFLLSSEKTYERKIREVVLSRRIEEAFDKDHILYLYLNQIYLGSGAYGVEAAARIYFASHVNELTLAEAAIIAGLPQRPSDYSPHRHWEKARVRQLYVLEQMEKKGFITAEEYESAVAEPVEVTAPSNEFLRTAPYFTEHIRRYLVDTYGFDKIYNDGLIVESTCDLDLQKAAQQAVTANVNLADNRIGWRGASKTLKEDEIAGWLSEQDVAIRAEVAKRTLTIADPDKGGGHPAATEDLHLTEGEQYEAVVLQVAQKHAVVGIGRLKGLIPLSWTSWAYPPNPERSWKYRKQNDMQNVVTRGDVVRVDLAHLSSEDAENLKGYAGAGEGPFFAAKLFQNSELEGALLSYRFTDGAVLAMVGGTDFEESEYNRAVQARRQVGSTFKPLVYTAAIESKQFTTGTLVQDAPTVFATLGDTLWKPGNYSGKYLGNISLRRALQMSRNVVTVRILDKLTLDPVYELAGPKLRIGYNQPQCSRTHIPADAECEGETTESPVSGMVWCESCDATSCPKVHPGQQTRSFGEKTVDIGDPKICLDEPTGSDEDEWCHSCDVNLRVCAWLRQEELPRNDSCIDARKDDKGTVWCRSCDLSMGLGSSSLTMVELARAYSAFGTYGKLVEPHYIERVVDRDGTVIEQWEAPEDGWPQVLDPSVAGITHWLLREVATGGTGARSNRLGITVAGKTGTTNDFFDAWFVGYNTEMVAASWVGYDKPRSMGQSFTGGQTALPVWMDYMRVAAPRDQNKRFPKIPGVVEVPIDETTGRVAIGGRVMPMLPGTEPKNIVGEMGQKSADDILTEDF